LTARAANPIFPFNHNEGSAAVAKIIKTSDIPERRSSTYPNSLGALVEPLQGRVKQALGDAVGLSQFGVNLTTLKPGAWSSQRHWHENEDEFIYVLSGQPTLITNEGEQTLSPGMAAGFKAGEANGHQLVNRTSEPAVFLEVGTRTANERAHYSDVDLMARKSDGVWTFTNRKGEPQK
jgi:uncharacterized cupin superfamily protein